jgi:deoxyribodipyrimidine photo-lyase
MISIHWFRRDLRLNDNAALFQALNSGHKVLCLFIFDTDILSKLPDKSDGRVTFISQQIEALKCELEKLGSSLLVKNGQVMEVWKQLISEYKIKQVFTNNDYEPYAIKRDEEVAALLSGHGIGFQSFKDQVVFEKNDILKDDGLPYTIFTPYSKKWKATLNENQLNPYLTENHFNNFHQTHPLPNYSITDIGFIESTLPFPEKLASVGLIENYDKTRDIPSIEGTSKLSLHFRFGTVSIRAFAKKALLLNEKWLNEIIWREFYMSILYHYPYVTQSAFKPIYDRIEWVNNKTHFDKWCEGNTGYPIVDAGMRQLNASGYMHNRVRMIVASFLCKHLLIDWRWGEAYFAEKLLDFELSSNNGGWQWAAGCGVDAAPYFRIFNPYLQTYKFDPQHLYIRTWVPEFETSKYPKPIVDHDLARKKCLETYKVALTK